MPQTGGRFDSNVAEAFAHAIKCKSDGGGTKRSSSAEVLKSYHVGLALKVAGWFESLNGVKLRIYASNSSNIRDYSVA